MTVHPASQTTTPAFETNMGSTNPTPVAAPPEKPSITSAKRVAKKSFKKTPQPTPTPTPLQNDKSLTSATTLPAPQATLKLDDLGSVILGTQKEQETGQAAAENTNRAAQKILGKDREATTGNTTEAIEQGFFDQISATASSVTTSVTKTVSGWNQAVSAQLPELVAEGTVLGSIYDTTSGAIETAYNATSGAIGTAYNATSGAIGTAYNATSTVVANNALGLGVVGAAVGGVAFANSTVTLLQGNTKDQTVREIAKLVAGAGLVALSVTYAASDDNERSTLAITALTSAFAKSVWDAVTAKAPRYIVFKLKAKEITPTQPRVVVIPKAA